MPAPLDEVQLSRLRTEAATPGRGFRRFFYVALAGSAFTGAFVFLMKIVAGADPSQAIPNFLLQVGIGTGLVWLWRREQPRK